MTCKGYRNFQTNKLRFIEFGNGVENLLTVLCIFITVAFVFNTTEKQSLYSTHVRAPILNMSLKSRLPDDEQNTNN